jgi:hypothetical protein
VDEFVGVETIELSEDRFINLESSRRWPKYIVEWSIRQRSDDSDFPLAAGSVERLPEAGEQDLDELREELFAEARAQAMDAAGRLTPTEPSDERRSFLSRLFGRGE